MVKGTGEKMNAESKTVVRVGLVVFTNKLLRASKVHVVLVSLSLEELHKIVLMPSGLGKTMPGLNLKRPRS